MAVLVVNSDSKMSAYAWTLYRIYRSLRHLELLLLILDGLELDIIGIICSQIIFISNAQEIEDYPNLSGTLQARAEQNGFTCPSDFEQRVRSDVHNLVLSIATNAI